MRTAERDGITADDARMAGDLDRPARLTETASRRLEEGRSAGTPIILPRLAQRTPAGKAMFQMMGVFAEFERAMIVERVKAGLGRSEEGVTPRAAHNTRTTARPT